MGVGEHVSEVTWTDKDGDECRAIFGEDFYDECPWARESGLVGQIEIKAKESGSWTAIHMDRDQADALLIAMKVAM